MLSESSCIPGFETMITVRPGSHVHRLITVLGLAGEYPVRSLGVLGNERTLRALVSKLSTTQELRNPDTDEGKAAADDRHRECQSDSFL